MVSAVSQTLDMTHFSTSFCLSSPFTPAFSFRVTRSDESCCNRVLLRRRQTVVASKDSPPANEIVRLTQKLEALQAKKEELLQRKTKEKKSRKGADLPSSNTPSQLNDKTIADVTSKFTELQFGKHSQGSRFLSLSTVDASEYYPRVIPLFANLDNVHPDDIATCPNLCQPVAPENGKIVFASVPSGYTGQLVAMPGVGTLAEIRDPIAIRVNPESVAENIVRGANDKFVLIVERNLDGIEFDNYKFYVWGVGDSVRVGWLKDLPSAEQARCLGRVICALMEEPIERRKAKSCWEEEAETY